MSTHLGSFLDASRTQDRLPAVESKSVADRIRVARESAGHKTIDDGAEATGLSSSGLGKLERGERAPELDSLIAIAKGYKVSLDWLAGLRAHPTGLPIGQFVVREAIVQAILEARCAEDLAELIRDPDVFEWWHQVEAESRVTSLEEWLALKERVKKHLHPFLEKIRELGTKKLKSRRSTAPR